MTSRTALILTFVSLSVAACGSESDPGVDSRCDEDPLAMGYAPGMVQVGDDGLFEAVLVESQPAPPSKGDNDWRLQLRTIEGTPLGSPGLQVTPFMPDHGHGTGIVPVITSGTEAGGFEVERINLWMPGLWQVYVDATTTDASDRITFSFCIEG